MLQGRSAWVSGYQGPAGWVSSQQKPAVWINHPQQSHQSRAGWVGGHQLGQAQAFGRGGLHSHVQTGWDRGHQGQVESGGGHRVQVGFGGAEQAGKRHSQQGFQGMTVQQLLEAHTRSLGEEIIKQREELRLIQLQINQQQLPYPVAESCAVGLNPSY